MHLTESYLWIAFLSGQDYIWGVGAVGVICKGITSVVKLCLELVKSSENSKSYDGRSQGCTEIVSMLLRFGLHHERSSESVRYPADWDVINTFTTRGINFPCSLVHARLYRSWVSYFTLLFPSSYSDEDLLRSSYSRCLLDCYIGVKTVVK